jgi:glycosyltransferase involved in cell wall biosynthesis
MSNLLSSSPKGVSSTSPEKPRSEALRVLEIGKSVFSPTNGGGLERMFDGLMRHLPAAGIDAHGLVADSVPSPYVSDFPHDLIDESASLPKRLGAFRRTFRSILDSRSVDLVAGHFALYTAPVLDLLRDLPLVIHFHGPWGLESGAEGESWINVQSKLVLERLVYRRARHFIVLSEAFRDVLTEHYGIPSSRISIIPGGVDIDQFSGVSSQNEARLRSHLPIGSPIAVSVRRLARRMGLEHLIEAWAEICGRHPDALLLIAGKGPLHSELQAQILRLGLEENVRLLGFVPDAELPLLYRAADVTVLPTVALEGFGLTTVESLAAGTPPLVTPVGGLPEVVRGLDSRLILRDASVASLVEGLSSALSNPGRLPSASACQAFARAHYSWPVIANKTKTVYESVRENSVGLSL